MRKILLPTAISVISAIAAIFSAYYACQQSKFVNKQLSLHITPELKTDLQFLKNNGSFRPVITIRNTSPINICSVAVEFYWGAFNKEKGKFVAVTRSVLAGEQVYKGYAIYEKRLEPNDFRSAELRFLISPKEESQEIHAFIVFCTYYRETDMERYDKRDIYFFENGKRFTHSQFTDHPEYEKLISVLVRAKMPEPDTSLPIDYLDISKKAKTDSDIQIKDFDIVWREE